MQHSADMNNCNSIEELFDMFSKDLEESDDSDWEPNKLVTSTNSWYCVNCTNCNEEEEMFCELCNEHKESGILQFGFMSSSDSKIQNPETTHDLFSDKFSSVKVPQTTNTEMNLATDVPVQDLTPPSISEPTNQTDSIFSPLSTAIGYDSHMLLHQEIQFSKKAPHPERPDRLRAILSGLWATGLFPGRCLYFPAREASQNELLSVHTSEHIESVEVTAEKSSFNFTVDTYANEFSSTSAKLAAGVSAEMARKILNKEIKNGIALVRPPGHHSECHAVMGFCLYNNVAIAAETAKRNGAKKVLIVDWDVHHGNGTQQIFESDPAVLFVSLHRHESGMFYPGTGAAENIGKDAGKGYCVNIAWPCGGINDDDYITAFNLIIVPIAKEFSPDLIIVSAGFDAARGDPLGGCDITPQGYAHMTHLLMSICDKILVILEGGYNLRSISSSMAAVTKVLLGDDLPPLFPESPTDMEDKNQIEDFKAHGNSMNDSKPEENDSTKAENMNMKINREIQPSRAAMFAINQTFFAVSPYWKSLTSLPPKFQKCSTSEFHDFQRILAIRNSVSTLLRTEKEEVSHPSSSLFQSSESIRKAMARDCGTSGTHRKPRMNRLAAALVLRRHRFWKSRMKQKRNANWFVYNIPFWCKFLNRRTMFNQWRRRMRSVMNPRPRKPSVSLEDE